MNQYLIIAFDTETNRDPEDRVKRTLKVGIASYDQMKARTLAVARGEHVPAKGEPQVWFTSTESFAKVLSENHRQLEVLLAGLGSESASADR